MTNHKIMGGFLLFFVFINNHTMHITIKTPLYAAESYSAGDQSPATPSEIFDRLIENEELTPYEYGQSLYNLATTLYNQSHNIDAYLATIMQQPPLLQKLLWRFLPKPVLQDQAQLRYMLKNSTQDYVPAFQEAFHYRNNLACVALAYAYQAALVSEDEAIHSFDATQFKPLHTSSDWRAPIKLLYKESFGIQRIGEISDTILEDASRQGLTIAQLKQLPSGHNDLEYALPENEPTLLKLAKTGLNEAQFHLGKSYLFNHQDETIQDLGVSLMYGSKLLQSRYADPRKNYAESPDTTHFERFVSAYLMNHNFPKCIKYKNRWYLATGIALCPAHESPLYEKIKKSGKKLFA